MTRLGLFGGMWMLVALVMTGCANSDTAPSPTPSPTPTPTPSSPTVSSIAINSARSSATTYQLQATASMSDGSTRDVTSAAQWDSSNPALCQISSTGLLTAMHSGDVQVRASFQNVTGSATLALNVPLFSLAGSVSDAPPSSRLLEGVKITLTAGPNTDEFTYTDDRGSFNFYGLSAGSHTLSIARAGYQPWSQTLTLSENVTNLPIVLYPIAVARPTQ